MGKVICLGRKLIYSKPIPKCPVKLYNDSEPCQHQGLSFSPVSSPQALSIASTLHKVHPTLSVKPIEYIVVNYHQLYANIPLDSNDKIIKSTIDEIPDAMVYIDNKVIDLGISCYTLAVYYSNLFHEIFMHYEDLHGDS